jgi:glutamyl-tRNA synthetase
MAEQGVSHVVRLRVPEKYPPWHDFVYGTTGKAGKESRKLLLDDAVYDDPIMIKSDGHPTYHLANVVDDHLMKITHVVRGSEWMSSTPMHLELYRAFEWKPPVFGHVPLLVDENRQKLSKRNLDTDIASFRDQQGIFPDALVNFAVLLGWSHQQKSDLLPLRRLEEIFDLKFTKGNTIVSFSKLQFLQERYARQYIAEGGERYRKLLQEVCSALVEVCHERDLASVLGGRSVEDVVGHMLRADWKAYTTPAAFASRISNLFKPLSYSSAYEPLSSAIPLATLRVVAASLLLVSKKMWTSDVHRENIAAVTPPNVADEAGNDQSASFDKAWKKEVYHYLRWSLMGAASGPPLPDLMEILGRNTCVERINRAFKSSVLQEQAGVQEKPVVTTLAAAG